MGSDTEEKNAKRPRTESYSASSRERTGSIESPTEDMCKIAEDMKVRAKENKPLDEKELDKIIHSLENLIPPKKNNPEEIDFQAVRSLLAEAAHLSHKQWNTTEDSAMRLRDLLLHDGGLTEDFRYMFERVVTEGNWDGSKSHSKKHSDDKPWVVLVTGVNGIRKTTSVYQSWFCNLLQEAIVTPTQGNANNEETKNLPSGDNSFFRQLDHVIATVTNEEFKRLYSLSAIEASKVVEQHNQHSGDNQKVVSKYSNLKASIFSRYRTLAEIIGIILIREAQKEKLNVMIETSGRDIAMFHYVEKFFPKETYKKLALHFVINDISHAEGSVDARMQRELQGGVQAIKKKDSVKNIIRVNAGGPYGSEVLKGVQKDSDKVWEEINVKKKPQSESKNDAIDEDWHKATIQIVASATEKWTAHAVKPDGSSGTSYVFDKPPKQI